MLRSEALHQVLLHPPLPPLLRHPCAHHFLPQRLHHLCGILSTKKTLNVMRQAQNFRQTLSGAKHSSRACLPPPMAHHGSLSHHVGHHVHQIRLIGHHVPHLVSN